MRANFQPISGAYLQLGLETWRAMTNIHDSHKAASTECSEDKLNKIEALTEKLSACLTVDPFVWQTAYDLVDEVLQEIKQLDIITFADTFASSDVTTRDGSYYGAMMAAKRSQSAPDDGMVAMQQRPSIAADAFGAKLMRLVGLVLNQNDTSKACMHSLCYGDNHTEQLGAMLVSNCLFSDNVCLKHFFE